MAIEGPVQSGWYWRIRSKAETLDRANEVTSPAWALPPTQFRTQSPARKSFLPSSERYDGKSLPYPKTPQQFGMSEPSRKVRRRVPRRGFTVHQCRLSTQSGYLDRRTKCPLSGKSGRHVFMNTRP